MKLLAFLPLAAVLSLPIPGHLLAAEPPAVTSSQPIREKVDPVVTSVTLTKSEKGAIVIHVKGTVPTGGWTRPNLYPHVYIVAPEDGIYGFTFSATPPEGMAIQVISPIEVKYTWETVPPGANGVSVSGHGKAVVAMLETAK